MVGYKTYGLFSLDQYHCDLTCDICQIQISKGRREKTYTMYSNENEHIGNKLLEDQKKIRTGNSSYKTIFGACNKFSKKINIL